MTAHGDSVDPPSVRISFGDLVAVGNREPLELDCLEADDHIHGDLLIEIHGRRLPHLGYFGVNDVCFLEWLEQLAAMRNALSAAGPSRYVFDEGEQGQPAFVFEKEGGRGYVTIADAEYSGGVADPEWQHVPFTADDFVAEIDCFRRAFIAQVRLAAPRGAEAWFAAHAIAVE